MSETNSDATVHTPSVKKVKKIKKIKKVKATTVGEKRPLSDDESEDKNIESPPKKAKTESEENEPISPMIDGTDDDDDEKESGDGTTNSNPNPVVHAKPIPIVQYQPGQKNPLTGKNGFSWVNRLTPSAIQHQWIMGPVDHLGNESRHADRDILFCEYGKHAKYRSKNVILAPMHVISSTLHGMGAVKFGKKATDKDRQFFIILTPKSPKNLYAPSLTFRDKTGEEIDGEKMTDDEKHAIFEEISRIGMICYNELVELHLMALDQLFEDEDYRPARKATQEEDVRKEMELTIDEETDQFTSTHEDYKDMDSSSLRHVFRQKLRHKWYAGAATPFGCVEPFDEKGAVVLKNDVPEMYTKRTKIDITTGEEIELESEVINGATPWFIKGPDGNYGGSMPTIHAKREASFGEIPDLKQRAIEQGRTFELNHDARGQVPWFELAETYGTKKIPDFLRGDDVPDQVRTAFSEAMFGFDRAVTRNDMNFVPTTYMDPFCRPLEQIGGKDLLFHDLRSGPASRGSICAITVNNQRTKYPDGDQRYGTQLRIDPKVIVYATSITPVESLGPRDEDASGNKKPFPPVDNLVYVAEQEYSPTDKPQEQPFTMQRK